MNDITPGPGPLEGHNAGRHTAIDVSIDEVVIRDLVPGAEARFVDAFHRQLTRLIEDSLPTAGSWPPRIESSRRLPPMAVAGDDPSALGQAVATSVHGLISGTASVRDHHTEGGNRS